MKLLAIDPSSTNLGWAVFQDEELCAYGTISTDKVPYDHRYVHIVAELQALYDRYEFDEIACERVIRFKGKKIPALEVAVISIRKWAERVNWRNRHQLAMYFYSPAEWKVSAAGNGRADKAAVARVICLQYPQLPADVSDHITDAIGIGQHHCAIRRLEEMADGST